MITPEQWKQIENQANKLYSDLELEIIQEIAERIANVGYANTVVLNNVLIAEEMGILYQDIINQVAKYNETSVSQIQEIFETAGVKSLEYDDKIYKLAGLNPIPLKQNSSMLQILEATAKKTNYNLNNLVMTTANTSQTQFYNAMNKAYMEVSTGVKSYSQSIIDTIKEISNQGAYIEYPSGQHRSIESAVRTNIITSVNQTCGKLQELRADEMGWDLMELTAHGGARPEHAEWQGKIVSRSGQKGYLSLDDIGYRTATGFKGVNCRHDWMPYYKGSTRTYTDKELKEFANETVTYNGQKISKYDASQIQRKIERQIRQDKKDIAGFQGILTSNTKDDKIIEDTRIQLLNAQNKLNQYNTILNDFTEQTKFRKDYTRLAVGNTTAITKQIEKTKKTISSVKTIKAKSKEENTPNNINDFYNYYKNKSNKVLTSKNLNEVLKYDAKPTIVSKKEFDKLAINNKYGILERGFKTGNGTISMEQILKNYKSGEFYVGEGVYGSGTYTAYGNNAHKIALSYAHSGIELSTEKNIIKLLLKDDAKVVNYYELRKMHDEEINKLIKNNGFKDYFDMIDRGLNNEKTKDITKYVMELQDMGVYASIKGYDAINVIDDGSIGRQEFNYLVILNRKKMIFYDG